MEFIKEFQEVMNQAIDRLLKKSARRHSRQKDKPEPCTEQGKHKEALCKEAEMLPPRNVSGESVRYHISYVDIYEYIYLLYFPLYNSFI